ncbi:hypothetical protein HZS_728 [Henneguya salminicola]|nr:hypothetical protein HZS_728 [Henneguya salminicola]
MQIVRLYICIHSIFTNVFCYHFRKHMTTESIILFLKNRVSIKLGSEGGSLNGIGIELLMGNFISISFGDEMNVYLL